MIFDASSQLNRNIPVDIKLRIVAQPALAGDFEGLAELVAARDRLLHDVSHELRSPLARMRLASGLLARRAVENVLRNAVRFSPRGEAIQMRLTRSGGNCTIFIEDVGPGIRAAEPRGLLKPFVQDRSPESAGYGLGLAIAQRAVAACAGTLDLANRNPTGLSVSITFPLALNPARPV